MHDDVRFINALYQQLELIGPEDPPPLSAPVLQVSLARRRSGWSSSLWHCNPVCLQPSRAQFDILARASHLVNIIDIERMMEEFGTRTLPRWSSSSLLQNKILRNWKFLASGWNVIHSTRTCFQKYEEMCTIQYMNVYSYKRKSVFLSIFASTVIFKTRFLFLTVYTRDYSI